MKTLYKLGMLAVAALAFAGCSKEVDNSADQKAGTHTLTFTVQKDVDTRTAVVEGEGVASYVWTEGDDQYFHIYENGVEATAITMVLSADKKIATFKATFDNTDATEFSYRATYGSDLASSKPHNPLIPADQKPRLGSFDPAADVLVSAEDIVLDGKADENTEFLFKLKRVVSVNKMILKGLKVGERIYKVELTSLSSDQYFSSRYSVEKGSYTGDAKTLVLDYENTEAYAGVDGTFPVYFISAPVSNATFSVRVVTDGVIYTRDDFTSKLTLAVGTFRRIGINLSGYDQPIMPVIEYTKVESDDQIADGGEYLIVTEEFSRAAGPYDSKKFYAAEDVVISNNKISIQTENASVFTLEAGEVEGQYYIKDQMGYYLKWTSGNSVERSNEKYPWTVTTTGITSVDPSDRRLQYNSGSPRFACYTTDQKAITLYVDESTLVELADPELSFAETTVNVAWGDIEGFTAPTLNNPHALTINYSSSDEEVATIDAATGEITFVGNGTTVITASSEKTSTYKAGSAQYTLVVSGAPVKYDFTSIAELNALGADWTDGKTENFSGELTNAIVSFVPDANNAIIKDETGSILFFKSGHNLQQGLTFSGKLNVTVKMYKTTYEITSMDASFTGSETEVLPVTVTLEQLVGNFSTYQNTYVKVVDLTVTGRDGKNISVSNGEKSYIVYDQKGNSAATTNDVITVVGTVGDFQGTNQIKAWDSDDITITTVHPAAQRVITITQPAGNAGTSGCSISATLDGTPIQSGDSVEEGKTVTISATEGTGFTFASWTVTGATVSGNTKTATFIVGTSNVTISASFTSETDNSVTVTYDFTKAANYPEGFPTTTGTYATSPTEFTIDGKSIIIKAPNAYYEMTNGSAKTLFFGKSATSFANTAYIEVPAKDGYYIESISVKNSSGCAAGVSVNIYSTTGSTVSTAVDTVKGGTMEFTLSSTSTNTAYRISSLASGKNFQFDNIVIVYNK